MIRVCFAGVTGWTARSIVAAIDAVDDLALVAGVSRSAAGKPLTTVTASRGDGVVHSSVAEALGSARVDVLVDFTSADAVKNNVWTAVEAGVHVVVGSSGLTTDDYAALDALARERAAGVIAAGNFSIMAAVLGQAAAMAAAHLRRWEIIDYGNADKLDVPSGTARELAETLASLRTPDSPVALAQVRGPVEARGADIAGSRIHSLRLPGFVVSTEIVFGGPGERLVIRHDPGETADPYVAGTLLAIRKVAEAPGVRRGLGSLLFDQSDSAQ